MWVEFKYENLATFCFYCEKVGHSERDYSDRIRDAKDGLVLERQCDWLWADQQRLGSRRTTIRVPEQVSQEVSRDQTVKRNAQSTRKLVEQAVKDNSSPVILASTKSLKEPGGKTNEDRIEGKCLALGSERGDARKQKCDLIQLFEVLEEPEIMEANCQRKAQESLPMLVDEDMHVQQLQGMENLVNIPIDLAKTRGILRDITSNVNRTKTEWFKAVIRVTEEGGRGV